MHNAEGKLSGRIYKKWVEKSRESVHLILAMLAVMMYILSKMLKLSKLETGADILFIVNLVLYMVQWNQNRIYQFSNLSRHVKGIPDRKLRMINRIYLLIILLLLAGVTFLILLLPLKGMFDLGGKWLYVLISYILGEALGKPETGGTVSVTREVKRVEGSDGSSAFLTDYLAVNTADRWILAAGCVIGVLLLTVCLVYLYRLMWKKISFDFDEEIVVLEKEERFTPLKRRLQAVRKSSYDGIEEQIRRNYRRYIRKRVKKGDVLNQSWTPKEIQEFIGVDYLHQESVEMCELYERARYANHACTSEELKRSSVLLKKKQDSIYER